MEYTLEAKTRVLILDERVYKGKARLYIGASEDLGIIKIIGKGLYMLGTFEVFVKKSRMLYYLVEAKPIYDYRHILKNPQLVEVYSMVFSAINGYYAKNKDTYTPFVKFLEKMEREPLLTSERVKNIIQRSDDPEGFLNELSLI